MMGIVGMIPVLVAVLAFFVVVIKQTGRAGSDAPWVLGVWCGLLGLALHATVEGVLHLPAIALIASLLMGLLIGITSPILYRTLKNRFSPAKEHDCCCEDDK